MFKLLLQHYIADAGLSLMFDNMQKNLRVAKKPQTQMVAPTEGDYIWIETHDGEQVVGEVAEVDTSGIWLEVFDASIADTIMVYYSRLEIKMMEIVDVDDD